MGKFNMKMSSLTVIIILLIGSFWLIPLQPSAVAQEENTSMDVLPSQITVDATQTELFNVSVWVYDVSDLFAYQVYMQVNETFVSISRAWVPRTNTSWVFNGKSPYVGTEPVFYDKNSDGSNEAVKMADSLIFGPPPFSGDGLLAVVELKIEKSPATTTLEIDNDDTFLLNFDLNEVSTAKNNCQVQLEGQIMEKYPSQVTISVDPTQVITGENMTIAGNVTSLTVEKTPLAGAPVVIQRRTQYTGWTDIVIATTDGTGFFSHVWITDASGSIQIRSKWDGNDLYYGNQSSTVYVTITEVVTGLTMQFADPEMNSLGKAGENLPTRPGSFNVTLMNVTDLYQWKIKIYYDPFILLFKGAWLPSDHAFSGGNFTAAQPETGDDANGRYVMMNAVLNEGEGFNGSATLFQMNFTGLRPSSVLTGLNQLVFSTEKGDTANTFLKDSSGTQIVFLTTDLAVTVLGTLGTRISVINPETADAYFNYFVEDTPNGSRFNVTLTTVRAFNMSGWRVKLTFNSTLLSVSRIIQPLLSLDYVFPGYVPIQGVQIKEDTLLVNETLAEIDLPVTVGEEAKLLAIIEFQIVFEPKKPENVTVITRVSDILDISYSETTYLSSGAWIPVESSYGIYTYGYSSTGNGDGRPAESIWDYLPYIIIIVVAIIAIYIVMKRLSKSEIPEEYLQD